MWDDCERMRVVPSETPRRFDQRLVPRPDSAELIVEATTVNWFSCAACPQKWQRQMWRDGRQHWTPAGFWIQDQVE